jgi:hypothetical protein
MKKFKIVLAVLLAGIMAFALAACGADAKPSDQVKADLDEIKSEEIDDEFLTSVFNDKDLQKKYGDDYSKLLKKVQEFDYEIVKENISDDGNSATVSVKITTYDFGKAYKATYEQVIKDASSGKITSSTDIESYVYKMMFKKMDALKKKNYTTTVKVKCDKDEDDNWETDIDDNDDMRDAVLGGMISAVDNVG